MMKGYQRGKFWFNTVVVVSLLAGLGLSLPVARPAFAATYDVTTTANSGAGSLRQAITDANANPGPDTIQFNLTYPATISLTDSLPIVSQDLTISGPVTASLTINAGLSRAFEISPTIGLTITNLTITNGNTSAVGGAVYNNHGTLNLTNTTLSDNHANGAGGAIQNEGGTLNITNSTFFSNTITYNGGAISNSGGTVNIVNSTFTGNTAQRGAGIYNENGTTNISNSTIAGNQFQGIDPNGDGEGIFVSAGTVKLKNSVVAGNIAGSSGAAPDISGAITSQGYNLVQNRSGASGFVASDLPNGTNPQLGPLQNNEGPTPTMAPSHTSPVLNAGNPAGCTDQNGTPITTDQRGAARPFGGRCDIGAVELPFVVVNSLADTSDTFCDPTGTGSGAQDCTLREALAAISSGQSSIKGISFNLTGNTPHTITISSQLPDLGPGTVIEGGCHNGPDVVLNGNGLNTTGLVLNGGVTLSGLKITGFKQQPLVVRTTNGRNILSCVVASF